MRNAAKVPFKFTFDIIIDSVDKLVASGDVVLVWDRSANKTLCTKPVKVDRQTRKAIFNNAQLSSQLTLFKNSPTDKTFQDKVVKLAVRAGSNGEGKTLAKIHLNLADYAEVPSGMKRISAELSNGSTLLATVQCAFSSMGKGGNGVGSKAGGKRFGGGNGSSESDEGDIALTETPSMAQEDGGGSGMLKNKLKMGRMGSKMGIGKNERRGRDSELNIDGPQSTGSNNGGGADGGSAAMERLRKENARMRKQVEEAEGGNGREDKLAEENKGLKKEIEDLKKALAREPEFGDVVKELKETKMALALLQLEKDQLALEVMRQQHLAKR